MQGRGGPRGHGLTTDGGGGQGMVGGGLRVHGMIACSWQGKVGIRAWFGGAVDRVCDIASRSSLADDVDVYRGFAGLPGPSQGGWLVSMVIGQ